MKRHNFKKLKIWQVRLKLSFLVSDILENFPKYQRYDLTSQILITHHKKYINNNKL